MSDKPNWYFRALQEGETTRDPIQGEFFSTEAIRNPTEALVREAIQNSLDAAIGDEVKIRIFLADNSHSDGQNCAQRWLGSAWPHFRAKKNGLREVPDNPVAFSYLVFEDFGTSGLEGNVSQPFDMENVPNDFYYFFRAEGRSSKSQDKRGRWGIGKYVFPRSSRLSTFFGLTIRNTDRKKYLMGRVILKTHQLVNENTDTRYCPDGYYGVKKQTGLVLPVEDNNIISDFCKDFCIKRVEKPGLSVVVPFIDADFTFEHLQEAVVLNYFYPILTGRLTVTIESVHDGKIIIDRNNLKEIVEKLQKKASQNLLPIINLAEHAACDESNKFEDLYFDKERPSWEDINIADDQLEDLRRCYNQGEIIGVRVYFKIPEINETSGNKPQFVIFIKKDGNETGRTVFIRDGIIISDIKAPLIRGVRSLVVIDGSPLATLLGDAENPAHTQWQANSSNFKNKYSNGPAILTFVKNSVSSLVHVITSGDEEKDLDLLADVFSLPTTDQNEIEVEGDNTKNNADETQNHVPEVEPGQRYIYIEKIDGGFSIKPGKVPVVVPASLSVELAYDVRRGNPLKKYREEDFQVDKQPVQISRLRNVNIIHKEKNKIDLKIENQDFELEVRGFDVNRDLYVKVKQV